MVVGHWVAAELIFASVSSTWSMHLRHLLLPLDCYLLRLAYPAGLLHISAALATSLVALLAGFVFCPSSTGILW